MMRATIALSIWHRAPIIHVPSVPLEASSKSREGRRNAWFRRATRGRQLWSVRRSSKCKRGKACRLISACPHNQSSISEAGWRGHPRRIKINASRSIGIPTMSVVKSLIWKGGMNRDGTFDFSGATTGNNDIDVISEEYEQIVAKLSVEVKSSDVNGLVLSPHNRLDLSGTVHLLDADSESHSQLQIFARDLDAPGMSHPYRSEVASDGTFKMKNVWPGKYIVGVSDENQ
jgi:hypothetical protein